MVREKLGEILIRAGLLDEASLKRALGEQQRWGGQLGRYLVDMKMISEETLVRALSTQYKIPAVALDPPRLNVAVGRQIPREICERNGLVCFRIDAQKKFLDVALSDPSNLDALEEVRVATRFNVRPHIAAPSIIDRAVNFIFYGDVNMVGQDLSPDSPLRDEPRTSELIRGTPPPLTPLPPPRSGVTPTGPGPGRRAPTSEVPLELQISPSSSEPALPPLPPPPPSRIDSSSARTTKQSLRPPEETFHITLDVPTVDKEVHKAQTNLEERLTFLEAVQARDAAILEALMEVLVRHNILSREEVLRLIINK